MHQENMVIVGAGHSGARAAQALRANGWQERITIIDAEGRTPYERPPLSKAVLKGERAAEVAPLFPAGYLAENGIAPGEAAMFEDLARNLEVPKALGMATVLVVPCGNKPVLAEAWETEGREGAHIDFITDHLGDFLTAIVDGLAARTTG